MLFSPPHVITAHVLWLSLATGALTTFSCKSLPPDTTTMQLSGAYDATYLLRLQPTNSASYYFESCLHQQGSAIEASCTPTFKNARNETILLTIQPISSRHISLAESQFIAALRRNYEPYQNHLDQLRNPVAPIVLGGTAGGISVSHLSSSHHPAASFHRHLQPSSALKNQEIASLHKRLATFIGEDASDPMLALRQLIDADATKTVFAPELIQFLDTQGLDAPLRSWLHQQGLSSAHYLLDSSRFNNLLTPTQQAEYMSRGGSAGLADSLRLGMEKWLLKEYQQVDALQLFRPQYREVIAKDLLTKWQYYYELAREFDPLTKSYGPRSVVPPRQVVVNFMMGFESPPQQSPRYDFGTLKTQEWVETAAKAKTFPAKTGLDRHYAIFNTHQNASLAHRHIDEYRRLQQLMNRAPTTSPALLKNAPPKWRKGMLGFMVNHRKTAIISTIITAIVINFSGTSAQPQAGADETPTSGADQQTYTNLILDLSSALWSHGSHSAQHSRIDSVEAMIRNIVTFQREVWLSHTSTELTAAHRIARFCLPIEASSATGDSSICQPI